jgi:hypothetical protein
LTGRIEAGPIFARRSNEIQSDGTRFEISLLGIGLTVGPAVAAEIIQDDIDILFVAAGHD